MAITFTTSDLEIDETEGVQLDEVATLPAAYSYLLTLSPQGTAGEDANFPQISYDASFLILDNVPTGTTVEDLAFTHPDAANELVEFSTTDGYATTLQDVDGNTIYLFQDTTNDNVLIGRIADDPDAAAAFAIILDEAADSQSAGAYIILYEAMQHNLDGEDPNDVIDLTNQLFVSTATTTTTTTAFTDFSDVRSGNTDFAIIGPDGTATGVNLLVTGDAPKGGVNGPLQDGTVNVSTQGIGSGSQSVGKNAVLQIDFINGGAANTTGKENKILYTDHIEDVTEAQFSLTQVNPTGELINLKVSGGDEQGNVQGSTFRDFIGDDVALTRVVVYDANGNVVEDSDLADDPSNLVTSEIINGDAVLTNLQLNYTVKVYSDGMDQIRITNNDDHDNASFDVGAIKFSQSTTTIGDEQAEVGSHVNIYDDAPSVLVADSSGTYDTGATGSFVDNPGSDSASLDLTFDSYKIGDGTTETTTATNSTFTKVNDVSYTGTITDDFNGDGTDDTVEFTLTLDPDTDAYDLTVTTPPSSVITKDTSQGSLKAGGPDGVRTLLFGGSEADADDAVFFGVVADASTSGILDLVESGEGDLTESQIEALNSPLVTAGTAMNVSTAGIGIKNNNLDGAGTGLQSGDESFVFNPEEAVDSVKVFIDNSVGGYTTATEDLFYTVYFTDGTVSTPTEVNALTPEAGGQVSFEIDGGAKEIDAVQLTMQRGTIKIPVISWTIEESFAAQPLDLNFTATEIDQDNDPATDPFSVHLSPDVII